MKKINIILIAFALAMTMSQCKKNEIQPNFNDDVVTITLDVDKNNGSRVVVNTATGTVDFESGDKIYVGSGGKYVGFLTHNGTNFSGNITNPTENQPLQFYFLGNVTPQETLSAGTTEECSVIISDQTEHLPVISCAASYENYVPGVTAYSAHLLNKCALVKFNVTTPSNAAICITGMKNKVTLDFANNTMTPSQDGEGVIVLPAGSGENVEKWAILLPQEATEEGTAYSEDGKYSGTRPAINAITENGYWADGVTISVNNTIAPIGAINGLFTINANGHQVYFSQGNLQYVGSATIPYWKFAEHQWNCLGNNGQGSDDETVDRDLFGWGTSGYLHRAFNYQPWSTSTNNNQYYAYDNISCNLYDQNGYADWGYNEIINGGNQHSFWRTLTQEEWKYIFNTRITNSEMRFVKAIVYGIEGLIIFPDDWDSSMYDFSYVNNVMAPFNTNTIPDMIWTSFETSGVVFLPAAGYRIGVSVSSKVGYYYSSSCNGYGATYVLYFNEGELYPNTQDYNCSRGYSVRLVQDYNQ